MFPTRQDVIIFISTFFRFPSEIQSLCVCARVCVSVCRLSFFYTVTTIPLKLPDVSAVKNPPANAGDMGLISGWGRSPGEGNGNPLQYSCLGNPMDRGA